MFFALCRKEHRNECRKKLSVKRKWVYGKAFHTESTIPLVLNMALFEAKKIAFITAGNTARNTAINIAMPYSEKKPRPLSDPPRVVRTYAAKNAAQSQTKYPNTGSGVRITVMPY